MKILTAIQAQTVYSAMCVLNAVGPDHGAEFHLGDWVYVRRVHLDGAVRIEDRADGGEENYPGLSSFAVAYGLLLPGGPITSNEVILEAVATANAHLSNACVPTFRELDQAICKGAPEVLGFTLNGQRQDDFAMGWNAAMTRVYERMKAVVDAQRALMRA